jgi:hypothetical protein
MAQPERPLDNEVTHVCGTDHICGLNGGDGKPCRTHCGFNMPQDGPVRDTKDLPTCLVCADIQSQPGMPTRRRWSR